MTRKAGDGAFTDNYLLYLLAQASAAASEAFHAELTTQGVPVSTWRILASLYPDARLNVGTLARRCLLKQPTLTRTLDRLAADGIIRRLHAKDDRRAVLVELTGDGQRLAAEKVQLAQQHETRVLAGYSEAEVADLKSKLRALLVDGEAGDSD